MAVFLFGNRKPSGQQPESGTLAGFYSRPGDDNVAILIIFEKNKPCACTEGKKDLNCKLVSSENCWGGSGGGGEVVVGIIPPVCSK